MPLAVRKADFGDVSALSRLMTQLMGHAISEDTMKNRLDFIAGSPFDSLYVCDEQGIVLGLLAFRIRENIEDISR